MTKTVIIGSNHAGIAAGNVLLDKYQDQEVVMIERNSNFSYLSCGTALWVWACGRSRRFCHLRSLFLGWVCCVA